MYINIERFIARSLFIFNINVSYTNKGGTIEASKGAFYCHIGNYLCSYNNNVVDVKIFNFSVKHIFFPRSMSLSTQKRDN